MGVGMSAEKDFSRDFTLEEKNGRLNTLESIRGGREG
jgi:hypothetical protein